MPARTNCPSFPAGAAVVAYANVQGVMSSEFRQRLTTLMDDEGKGRQEFQEHTGIDVERDIDAVIAAMSPGAEVGHDDGFVALRGRFDIGKIEALVVSKGGQIGEYKGARLLQAPAHSRHPSRPPNRPSLTATEPTVAADAARARVAGHRPRQRQPGHRRLRRRGQGRHRPQPGRRHRQHHERRRVRPHARERRPEFDGLGHRPPEGPPGRRRDSRPRSCSRFPRSSGSLPPAT